MRGMRGLRGIWGFRGLDKNSGLGRQTSDFGGVEFRFGTGEPIRSRTRTLRVLSLSVSLNSFVNLQKISQHRVGIALKRKNLISRRDHMSRQ